MTNLYKHPKTVSENGVSGPIADIYTSMGRRQLVIAGYVVATEGNILTDPDLPRDTKYDDQLSSVIIKELKQYRRWDDASLEAVARAANAAYLKALEEGKQNES